MSKIPIDLTFGKKKYSRLKGKNYGFFHLSRERKVLSLKYVRHSCRSYNLYTGFVQSDLPYDE
uniref:SFRICE_016254 n=1 Tax=Spodoptera frugiperda TaxID=7108 RepID=A0A2H1WJK7_SPOFR